MRCRWPALLLAATSARVLPADAPEFIEYHLRAESSLQSQSNPFRLSYDFGRERLPADTVVATDVHGAAIVPVLSEDTRLLLSGSLGQARYDRNTQLDHRPYRADAIFQWRIGDLLRGSAGVSEAEKLNPYLGLSAPERDMILSRSGYADVGLRITESLTLPVVTVSRNTQRYEFARNAALYDRDEQRAQVAVRYAGIGASYVQAGIAQSQVDYIGRTPDLAALIDNRYVDRELFLDSQWAYSDKTLLIGRLGYRRRSYRTLADRDVDLATAEARAIWQYSPKTQLDLHFWRRPYGNEEVPTILYSTLTGVRSGVRWRATEKSWYSLNVASEGQRDTRTPGEPSGSSRALRAGARMEWAVYRNVTLVADGWREQVRGVNYPSFSNTVVRLGVVLTQDNRGSHNPQRLLRLRDCEPPRYVEATTCYD